MKAFFIELEAWGKLTADTIMQTILICGTVIVSMILFLVGARLGVLKHLRIGRDGVAFEGKEKEKQFQAGNIDHLLRDQIQKLDVELMDYAIDRSNFLRKSLSILLSKDIRCISTRRALASCLRYPLYFASMRNNFKYVLRPENTKHYAERIMKEVIAEYEEFDIEHDMAYCPANPNMKCPDIPPLSDTVDMIQNRIHHDWALSIRDRTVVICRKKIDLYLSHVTVFEELGDTNRVKITELCIDKNRGYIAALNRKPEPGEI